MATTTLTGKVGQKVPEDVIKRIREAAKHPIVYTEDCPESTPEALKEFAMLARERDRQNRLQAVTIRLRPDYISKYKSLGKGYTSIMADVLKYVADNPKLLEQAVK